MASPHSIIAKAIQGVIAAWAVTGWADAVVEYGFQLERFTQLVKADASKTVIGVLPLSADDQPDRATRRNDEDLITVSVVIVSALSDIEIATIEDRDSRTHLLRKHLKGLNAIPVGDEVAERESVKLFTAFDHDQIPKEIWASLILCEYSFDEGAITEVTVS